MRIATARSMLAAVAGCVTAAFAGDARTQTTTIFCQPVVCDTFRELRDDDKAKLQDAVLPARAEAAPRRQYPGRD